MITEEIRNTIENTLYKLEDDARDFEVILTDLVINKGNQIVEDDWKELFANKDSKLSYIGFYALNILYRRSLDYQKLHAWFVLNEDKFTQYKSFLHLKAMCVLSTNYECDYQSLLNAERDLTKEYLDKQETMQDKNIAGFAHAFVDLFVTLIEKEKITRDEVDNYDEMYALAEKAVDCAIRIDSKYAKYYCTRGRLCALIGDEKSYIAADKDIYHAIEIENSKKGDYAVRIGQYQYYRLSVQSKMQMLQMTDEYKETERQLQEQIKDIKGQVMSNIEILGFFAGIISFILGSLSLATGQTAANAAGLIIVLMGTLLGAFAGFGFILSAGKGAKKKVYSVYGVVFLVGLCFIGLGLKCVGA